MGDRTYRMLGYVVTIVLHVGNIVVMFQPKSEELAKDPEIQRFNSLHGRFLTGWTFFLQIVYAVTGLLCDILEILNSKNKDYKLPKHLRGFRDTLFSAIVWPSTLVVFSLFWVIFTYDRSLVFPEFLDKILSPVSNHIMHTAILPLALWEIYFQPKRQPRSHKRYLAHLIFHFGLYSVVLFYTYFEKGVWVYPVLAKIYGTVYFPLIFIVSLLFALLSYSSQWILVTIFEKKPEKSKKKQR